ncbi:MAG: DUF167 family protein [Proteobacteria bacterium]|nr:DUF167 family protein [Pseudomonadota bacterium]
MDRPWRCEGGAITLHLRLTPKGGRDSFDGFAEGSDGKTHALARVRAVPEDGAANAALVALLSKTLGVRKTVIEVVAGHTARLKTLRIEDGQGVALDALEAHWGRQAGATI